MSSITSLTPDSGHARRWQGNWLILVGLAVLAFWAIGTLIAPITLPYEPLQQNINHSLQPPNPDHPWGADKLGRDVFTRVLYGARISLPAGLIAVTVSLFIGTTVGALAGYLGGLWDELLMRITEVFLAFPTIILAMAVAAALGPSVVNAIITIAVVAWPKYARVTRGLVMSIKHLEYVEAARAIGSTDGYVLTRTILPNCISSLIILATLDLGDAILIFAGLSFLGLGPAPETPEWGRMIADGIEYSDQWWVSAYPGLAIFSVVMALNFVGDGLRDALDPRTRGR